MRSAAAVRPAHPGAPAPRDGSDLLLVGASCATTPVEVLDRLAVTARELPTVLAELHAVPHVREVVVLSTCNRVELYAVTTSPTAGRAALEAYLRGRCGRVDGDPTGTLRHAAGQDAVQHLFAVATGLRSLVVGEPQVVGQVRDALTAAVDAGCCGPRLQSLFRAAVATSRRTRRSTGVSDAAGSMVEAGLAVAAETLGDLADRTVLVVGAGRMGRLVARRLDGRAARLLVTNRSEEPARRLAERAGAHVVPWEQRGAALAGADLVVCSTGASVPVLDRDRVAAAVRGRGGRPLVLLDLAVPRDVAPRCGELPTVVHVDLDTIRGSVVGRGGGDAVPAAEAAVAREAARFVRALPQPEVNATITALRGRGERIRVEELERVRHRLEGLDPSERELVERLTQRVVQRLLHEPSAHLGHRASCPHEAREQARVVADLFEL